MKKCLTLLFAALLCICPAFAASANTQVGTFRDLTLTSYAVLLTEQAGMDARIAANKAAETFQNLPENEKLSVFTHLEYPDNACESAGYGVKFTCVLRVTADGTFAEVLDTYVAPFGSVRHTYEEGTTHAVILADGRFQLVSGGTVTIATPYAVYSMTAIKSMQKLISSLIPSAPIENLSNGFTTTNYERHPLSLNLTFSHT